MPDVKTHDLGFLRLDLPDTWRDEILVLALQGPRSAQTGARPRVTLAYDRLGRGESLDQKAEERIVAVGSDGPDPRTVLVEGRETKTIDGRAALQLRLLVLEGRDTMTWTMLLIDPGGQDDRQMPVLTCIALADDAGVHAATFERVAKSVLFDELTVSFSEEEEKTDPSISLPFAIPKEE